MTLCSRVAMVRGAYWPAILAVMTGTALLGLATVRDPGAGLFALTVGAGIALTVAWRPLAQRLLRSIFARHAALQNAALDEGDDETRRTLLAEEDEYYRRFVPRPEGFRLRLQARALAGEEKWSEAQAVIAQLDGVAVSANERVHHDNLVAWIGAHAGEAALAVERARANAAAPADASTRTFLLGTLGTSLVLDGQPAAALAPLRESIALGGPRWAQAVRRYYLGDALAALGRLDEARAEWHQAVAIAPQSRWGRRAQERLAAGAPAAYR